MEQYIEFAVAEWPFVAVWLALVGLLIWSEGRKAGKALSTNEMTLILNRGDAQLVDLRDKADFKSGHIASAVNIPFSKLESSVSELQQGKTIILVDKMGQHAGSACQKLKKKGYDAVRLRGGMTEWSQQSLPVVSE